MKLAFGKSNILQLQVRTFARKSRRMTGMQRLHQLAQKRKQEMAKEEGIYQDSLFLEIDKDYLKNGEKLELEENHYFKLLDQIMENKSKGNYFYHSLNIFKPKISIIPLGINENDEFDPKKLSKEEFIKAIEEAEAELSDMEYVEKNNSAFKFVSPPSSHKELLKTASEVDVRYKLSKRFLDGKMSDSYYEDSNESKERKLELSNRIPPNFMISTLVYPATNSEVILCGVENRSYIHAHMLSDILLHFNPNVIFTQISPDETYFVRKPKKYETLRQSKFMMEAPPDERVGYKSFWRSFMSGQGAHDFYINPGPHYLADAILFKNKNSSVMEENLLPCQDEFDIGANIAYTRGIEISENEMLPDCFFTPIVHQYNNLDDKVQVVIGGYPILALRDMIVKNYEFDELYEHFSTMLQKFQDNDLSFDPQYLMIDHCIQPQAEYISEVLRQTCHSSKKIIAVVDKEMVPHLEKEWKNLPKERKLVDLYKKIPSNSSSIAMSKKPYIEFVQQHAILDVMLNSFINDNFMKYDYFPMNGVGLFNWQSSPPSTKEYWMHFYKKYMNELGNIMVTPEGKEKHSFEQKYQESYEEPKLFS